jgi:hypothetical protein
MMHVCALRGVAQKMGLTSVPRFRIYLGCTFLKQCAHELRWVAHGIEAFVGVGNDACFAVPDFTEVQVLVNVLVTTSVCELYFTLPSTSRPRIAGCR